MSNEVVIKSGRMLPVGDKRWEIRDGGEPVKFVEFLTEARHGNGVVYLAFASGIMDADNTPIADIACRLRMHLGTAQFLHKMLGDMISDALKPVDDAMKN